MADIPMKHFWMGRDIEELSREELIEVVKYLGRELDSTRNAAISGIKTMASLAKAAAR